MEAQRNELLTRVRSILTNAQRQQFDLNLQEMEQRRGQRGRVETR